MRGENLIWVIMEVKRRRERHEGNGGRKKGEEERQEGEKGRLKGG